MNGKVDTVYSMADNRGLAGSRFQAVDIGGPLNTYGGRCACEKCRNTKMKAFKAKCSWLSSSIYHWIYTGSPRILNQSQDAAKIGINQEVIGQAEEFL